MSLGVDGRRVISLRLIVIDQYRIEFGDLVTGVIIRRRIAVPDSD
jgi:hypothetical protein